MADEGQQPVIIKRVKKAAHGHHGGAWKLAYADFVTAMMAFFLLLWLLNAVTEEQLQGIADYFAPTTVSQSNNGAGGMLGGQTIGKGAETSNSSAPAIALSLPPPTIGSGGEAFTDAKEGYSDQQLEGLSNKPNEQPGTGLEKSGEGKPKEAQQQAKAEPLTQAQITDQQLAEAQAEKEQEQFEKAQQALKQAINSIPELAKLANSLLVDNTPEGLRIQIVDQEGLAMFPSGSADMYGHTRALLELVGRVIKQLPEPISISGHTDSVPFAGQTNYTNWELSADRALAARRVLTGEGGGVPPQRVLRVVGQADTAPLLPNDPTNPRNRRLTIVLLRQNTGAGPAAVGVTSEQMKSGRLPAELKPGASPSQPAPAATAPAPAATAVAPAPAATGTAPAPKQ